MGTLIPTCEGNRPMKVPHALSLRQPRHWQRSSANRETQRGGEPPPFKPMVGFGTIAGWLRTWGGRDQTWVRTEMRHSSGVSRMVRTMENVVIGAGEQG